MPLIDTEQTAARVLQILANVCRVGLDEIAPDTCLYSGLWVDDIDRAEIAIGLEREFKVSIPDETEWTWQTPKDITDYLQQQPA